MDAIQRLSPPEYTEYVVADPRGRYTSHCYGHLSLLWIAPPEAGWRLETRWLEPNVNGVAGAAAADEYMALMRGQV